MSKLFANSKLDNNVLVVPLKPEIQKEMLKQYGLQTIHQLKSVLEKELLELSNDLCSPVWMSSSATVSKCTRAELLLKKQTIGEIGRVHFK